MRSTTLAVAAAIFAIQGAAFAAESPPARAADAVATQAPLVDAQKRDLVRRYFIAIHYDALIGKIVNSMLPAMMDSMMKNNPNLTSKNKQDLIDAMNESLPRFLPKMDDGLIDIFSNTFSTEELTKLVEFYENPIGQSIMTKSMTTTSAVTNLVKEIAPQIQAEITARLCQKVACPPLPKDKAGS